MRFQTEYYFRKGMVVQQDFEKVAPFMVQEIRSLKKLAIFFRVSRWGRKGGEGGGGGGGGLYAVLYGIFRGSLLYI